MIIVVKAGKFNGLKGFLASRLKHSMDEVHLDEPRLFKRGNTNWLVWSHSRMDREDLRRFIETLSLVMNPALADKMERLAKRIENVPADSDINRIYMKGFRDGVRAHSSKPVLDSIDTGDEPATVKTLITSLGLDPADVKVFKKLPNGFVNPEAN